MKKQFITEAKRMQQLAGILKENQMNENSLENKIKQWVEDNAGGYGPDEDDENYSKFNNEMNILLDDTLDVFNPGHYGDSTTMSPNDIVKDFIEDAVNIIAKYTMDYYGDSTSFSPENIKNEFYKFIK
jgi:hypothetical protein